MPYSLDASELIGTIGETALYGIYVIAFAASLFVMHHNRRAAGWTLSNIYLGAVAMFLFLCVTAHWVIDVSRVYSAFVINQSLPMGPLLFYAKLSEPRSVARIIIFILEIIALDSLLIYRLYIIWSKTAWVTILPALTLIGSIAACVNISIGFARAPLGFVLAGSSTGKWVTVAYSLSLATNSLAVVFIAFKIMSRDKMLKSTNATSLVSLLLIIVEGAGMNCILSIITLAFLLAGSLLNFTTLAMASPVTGISFSLITLRVGLRRAVTEFINTYTTTTAGNTGTGAYPMTFRVTQTQERSGGQSGGTMSELDFSKKSGPFSESSILP